jgi:hypothetical protein
VITVGMLAKIRRMPMNERADRLLLLLIKNAACAFLRSAMLLHGHRLPAAAIVRWDCRNDAALDSSDNAQTCFSFIPLKRSVSAHRRRSFSAATGSSRLTLRSLIVVSAYNIDVVGRTQATQNPGNALPAAISAQQNS